MSNTDNLPYVEAELNYLGADDRAAALLRLRAGPGRAALEHDATTRTRCAIHDMRPISHDSSLDTQGFALVEQRSAVQDFWDDDEVRRVYYPEAERFIKQRDRRQPRLHLRPSAAPPRAGLQRPLAQAGRASRRPACMSTTPPARARSGSATCCPTRPRNCCKGRVQVINLWRPILRARCRTRRSRCATARTVASDDLVPVRPRLQRTGSARPTR